MRRKIPLSLLFSVWYLPHNLYKATKWWEKLASITSDQTLDASQITLFRFFSLKTWLLDQFRVHMKMLWKLKGLVQWMHKFYFIRQYALKVYSSYFIKQATSPKRSHMASQGHNASGRVGRGTRIGCLGNHARCMMRCPRLGVLA